MLDQLHSHIIPVYQWYYVRLVGKMVTFSANAGTTTRRYNPILQKHYVHLAGKMATFSANAGMTIRRYNAIVQMVLGSSRREDGDIWSTNQHTLGHLRTSRAEMLHQNRTLSLASRFWTVIRRC